MVQVDLGQSIITFKKIVKRKNTIGIPLIFISIISFYILIKLNPREIFNNSTISSLSVIIFIASFILWFVISLRKLFKKMKELSLHCQNCDNYLFQNVFDEILETKSCPYCNVKLFY